jgi:nucleoside-triphosphatase
MSIYIFTRPVHSGKTTELLQWYNLQKNIHGILMPDINGCRKFLNLSTKEVFDAECDDAGNTMQPITSIGKFNFYTAAFEKANAALLHALSQNPHWLVIDEAGKLELDGKGFYKSILKAVDLYGEGKVQGDLIITVRDSLTKEIIAFYKIKNYKIINTLKEIK